MDNEAIIKTKGTVDVGGKTFVVNSPTAADLLLIRDRVQRAVELQSPLKAILADLKDLPPAVQQAAIKEAVALQAGGGAELSAKALTDFLASARGTALILWSQARHNHAGLALEDVEALVTPENMGDVQEQLDKATGMRDHQGNGRGPRGWPATRPSTGVN